MNPSFIGYVDDWASPLFSQHDIYGLLFLSLFLFGDKETKIRQIFPSYLFEGIIFPVILIIPLRLLLMGFK